MNADEDRENDAVRLDAETNALEEEDAVDRDFDPGAGGTCGGRRRHRGRAVEEEGGWSERDGGGRRGHGQHYEWWGRRTDGAAGRGEERGLGQGQCGDQGADEQWAAAQGVSWHGLYAAEYAVS